MAAAILLWSQSRAIGCSIQSFFEISDEYSRGSTRGSSDHSVEEITSYSGRSHVTLYSPCIRHAMLTESESSCDSAVTNM